MNERAKYLLSPWFIGSLLLLICNDLWWKAAYSNTLTGKLSDFSGVLVLGLLFNFFSERNRNLNALFVIVFFTFWKSPLSEGLIVTWNGFGLFPVERMVDYTDLWAFAMLPIVSHLPFPERKFRMVPLTALLACTAFAFASTSRSERITGWEYNGIQDVLSFRFYGTQENLKNELEIVLGLYPNRVDTLLFESQRVESTLFVFDGEDQHRLIDSAEIIVLPHNASIIQVHVISAYLHPGQSVLEINRLNKIKHLYGVRKVKVWEASVNR